MSEQLHPHADAVVTVATALSAMMLSVYSRRLTRCMRIAPFARRFGAVSEIKAVLEEFAYVPAVHQNGCLAMVRERPDARVPVRTGGLGEEHRATRGERADRESFDVFTILSPRLRLTIVVTSLVGTRACAVRACRTRCMPAVMTYAKR